MTTTHRRPSRTENRQPLPDVPITSATAAERGWSASAQRHSVRVGDAVRLRRTVLCNVPPSDPAVHPREADRAANLRSATASALTCARARISHASAAIAWGVPTFCDVGRPCLTVQSGTALRNLVGVHLHRATVIPSEVVDLNGLAVLEPARTVLDVAREHGIDAGVVAADYALHEGLTDFAALGEAYERCKGWPGRKYARQTLLLADGDSESVLESLSRLQMGRAGLPAPKLQQRICDAYGRPLGRVDFYWDEFGVVGEADGNLKYEQDPGAYLYEKARQIDLEDTGLLVVRWGWAGALRFESTALRLGNAFLRGVRPDSPLRRWGLLPS